MLASEKLSGWSSKGKTISASSHHQDMFIVDHGDGTFHNVSSSHEIMRAKYPVTVQSYSGRYPRRRV